MIVFCPVSKNMKIFNKKIAIIILAVLFCFLGLTVKAAIDLRSFTKALIGNDPIILEAFAPEQLNVAVQYAQTQVNAPVKDECASSPAKGEFCGPCKNTTNPNEQCNASLECSNKTDPSSGQCQSIGQISFCPITTHTSFECLINSILKWIFNLALIIAPLMILLGGFYVLTAAGDPSRATQGKKILTWAIIGLAVILTAKAFISIITSVLK